MGVGGEIGDGDGNGLGLSAWWFTMTRAVVMEMDE